jgi:hypothetical protein
LPAHPLLPARVPHDRIVDQDEHRRACRLRNAAISVLNLVPLFDPKEPIRARADRLNRDPELAVELFAATFS